MRVTCIYGDSARQGFTADHGLSFFIEAKNGCLLFDLGKDFGILESNARKAAVNIKLADTAVISHAHDDHGGALSGFLGKNETATVYVGSNAFAERYSLSQGSPRAIGLDAKLSDNPRIITVSEPKLVTDGGYCFTSDGNRGFVPDNSPYRELTEADSFAHEQSLFFPEKSVLFCGCAHKGILNIIDSCTALFGAPKTVIGGFHTTSPSTGKTLDETALNALASVLLALNADFYTCHCTGERVTERLSELTHGRVRPVLCGDVLEL